MSKRELMGIKLDGNSMTAFQQAIRYELDNLGGITTEVLEWAAFSYVKSARKVTRKARKNAKRKVERRDNIPKGRKRRDQKNKSWSAIVLTQRASPRLHIIYGSEGMSKAEAKKTKIAAVPNIGASKNSWYGALRDTKNAIRGEPLRKKTSGVNAEKQKHVNKLTVWNKLTYILRINPDIESVGLRNAAKGIALRVERKIGKRW